MGPDPPSTTWTPGITSHPAAPTHDLSFMAKPALEPNRQLTAPRLFPAWVRPLDLSPPNPSHHVQKNLWSPTTLPDRGSANALTGAGAAGQTVPMPTHVGQPGTMGLTQPRGAPSAPSELPPGAHTTLQHTQFERKLAHHPDKVWVSSLQQCMKYGFQLGYTGPRTCSQAHNLLSAAKHTEVIDAELVKEAAAG